MNRKYLILIVAYSLYTSLSFSQVTVEGYAFLNSQIEHDSVQVNFEQTIPNSFIKTILTSSSGYYSCELEIGVYNISYVKDLYYSYSQKDIEIFDSKVLDEITLIEMSRYLMVPNSFPTIQSAIDAANDEDTIIVLPGTYFENINFLGKNITLGSNYIFTGNKEDIHNTIIDGGNSGRVVKFVSGEKNAALIGFSITNGRNMYEDEDYGKGAGIVVKAYSTPRLEGLEIYENHAEVGGGVYIHYSNPLLINITIRNNTANYGGGIYTQSSNDLKFINIKVLNNNKGGIVNYSGKLSLINSIIANNIATRGGGIEAFMAGYLKIYNSLITNNSCSGDGGGIIVFASNLSIYNSIISNNSGNYGVYVSPSDPSTIVIENTNSWNNKDDNNYFNCGDYVGDMITVNSNNDACDLYRNISEDPLFIDQTDYTLSSLSPCIDAGNSDFVTVQEDFYSNDRIIDGDNNGSLIVDMGPAEHVFNIDLGPDIEACEFEILGINTEHLTYNWNDGLSNNDSLKVYASGLYFLEVTNSNGLMFSDSINVIIHQNPMIKLGRDTTVCGSIYLTTKTEFINYNWNNDLFLDDSLFVEKSGAYFVQVTDQNNCSNYSDTIRIDVNNTFYHSDSIVIWEGDSILWHDNYYKASGHYYENFLTVNSCDSIYELILNSDQTFSITELALDEIEIWPNPANEKIHFKSSSALGKVELTILSVEGKVLVKKQNVKLYSEIDISNLKNGMYLLRISIEEKVIIKKFIKCNYY